MYKNICKTETLSFSKRVAFVRVVLKSLLVPNLKITQKQQIDRLIRFMFKYGRSLNFKIALCLRSFFESICFFFLIEKTLQVTLCWKFEYFRPIFIVICCYGPVLYFKSIFF